MMKIEFEKEICWTPALEGVVTWANVEGTSVGCVFEGRAITEYFGVENEPWKAEKAYLQNRSFLEEIARDAIRRGLFNERGEVLLGKEELTPYFAKRSATAPA